MKTADEYRAMAEECFQWAREAKANAVRVSLEQLAQFWTSIDRWKMSAFDPKRTSFPSMRSTMVVGYRPKPGREGIHGRHAGRRLRTRRPGYFRAFASNCETALGEVGS
jgi:hypothetical protein